MESNRPLLILDLDETLIYATKTGLDRDADFQVGPYRVYRRPGLGQFLAEVSAHYELAVWTSSSPNYAAAVRSAIFSDALPLAFCWASDRCTYRRDLDTDSWVQAKKLVKLKRLGYRLERILVVDDSPEKHRGNYGNLVRVKPFEGDSDDGELLQLLPYLRVLHAEPDFRRIEKRFWRQHISAHG